MTHPARNPNSGPISSLLRALPEVTVVREDPVGLVRSLKAEDSPFDVCLVGGASLAAAVLPEIDRVVVKLYPVLAGAGRPAFDAGEFSPARFDLADVSTFEGGHVVLTWDRRPRGGPHRGFSLG
mgnify:CR=1 FL=1